MIVTMIKIMHVLTDTNIGGAGIWLQNFVRAFDRNRYEVIAALPVNAALTPRLKALGIRVCEVANIADESFSLTGIKEFKQLFAKEKPDIVHTHASLSARIAARRCKIPVVNTRHCIESPKQGIKKLIYSTINNYLSDVVIGVSKASYDNLLADGTKKDKLRLVYNGVYPIKRLSAEERKNIRARYKIPENNLVVGIVARLEPVKNHKLFLDAAALIEKQREDITFLIVGGGSCEQSLKEYAAELGIEKRVIFAGYCEDITELMNIIDINTLTSCKEALSISLIEGMSINIPAVATDSGGPAEVIENNVSGIIVKNHDAKIFAEAVLYLANNPKEREKMGMEGKKRSEDIFSIEEMIKGLEEIYDRLADK